MQAKQTEEKEKVQRVSKETSALGTSITEENRVQFSIAEAGKFQHESAPFFKPLEYSHFL